MAAIPVTSGLQLLLDARSITGLNDGDAIASWNDDSGNGNNASQSTVANRLVYKTNISGSNPAARADTANKQIGGAFSSWMSGTGATLLACVSNVPSAQTTGGRWLSITASGLNDTSGFMVGLGGNLDWWVNGAQRISLSGIAGATSILTPIIIGGAVDSSEMDLLINSKLRGNLSHVFSLPSGTQAVYATGRIASGSMSAGFSQLGDYHFLVAYSRRLSDTEINDVCSWMRSELGLETASGGTSRPTSPFFQGVIG